MAENWNSYFCRVNDKLASIRVDLGLRSGVPDALRPWLLWVWVYFKRARPDGLSSQEEFAALSALEDALTAALGAKCQGVLCGCITNDGRREFYFYGATPERFDEMVAQVMRQRGYRFDCDKQEDRGWTQYLNVLYPSEEQRQLIENRRLMDFMAEKGDTLEGAREVDHWARFKNQKDRVAFREAAVSLGYQVRSEYEEAETECPCWIQVFREQQMDRNAIDEAVLRLFRASKSVQGEYDGWECQLMADTKPAVEPKPRWKFW